MSVKKMPNGRWRAKLKSGRVDVASKVFDTKREAEHWHSRERAALVGGVDPRAGRERVRDLMDRWLAVRETTVAKKTYKADVNMRRLTPTSMLALQVAAVSDREVSRAFVQLLKSGQAESSVVRYRASLSSFFAWCVREKVILTSPIKPDVKVPKSSEETVEMMPFSEAELEAAYQRWRNVEQLIGKVKVTAPQERLANVLIVLGWTGLRWAEARAVTVADFRELPTPGLRVARSAPEGIGTKATKGRRSRWVPVADRVLPIIRQLAMGKEPGDLLLTTDRGKTLHRSAVLRSLDWENTAQGRRIHDLRHTAACLWLTKGVDVSTVQQWMGHESLETTNRYVHFLGTDADKAGLAKLNAKPGGTRGAHKRKKSK